MQSIYIYVYTVSASKSSNFLALTSKNFPQVFNSSNNHNFLFSTFSSNSFLNYSSSTSF